MPRQTPRPEPDCQIMLSTLTDVCPACGRHIHADHKSSRVIATLNGLLGLTCQIRRCHGHRCDRFLDPYRPEPEGRLALPGHHFGLDVIAFVGQSRYLRHRSVPEIHQDLRARRVVISPRATRNLLDRYDELATLHAADPARLRQSFAEQKRAVLAIDGLQPDVGHEVLWVVRDCLSGRIVLAQSLLSATATSRQVHLATLHRSRQVGWPWSGAGTHSGRSDDASGRVAGLQGVTRPGCAVTG